MCHVDNVLVPEACPGEALNTQPLIHSPPSNTLFIQESESVRLALLESTKLAMFTWNYPAFERKKGGNGWLEHA